MSSLLTKIGRRFFPHHYVGVATISNSVFQLQPTDQPASRALLIELPLGASFNMAGCRVSGSPLIIRCEEEDGSWGDLIKLGQKVER